MKRVLALLFSLGLLCGLGYVVFRGGEHGGERVLKMSAKDSRAYWSAEIDRVGAEDAYEDFKRMYMHAAFTLQHPAAHVFGALLFEKGGIEGFSVCDQTFAFGCYHGYFGSAVAGLGTDVVEKLDQKCIELYGPYGTGCQHGIGHGVMEFMGDDIDGALALCARTTQVDPLFGCTSGVFMEYNTPISISGDDASQRPRAFNEARPYTPCTSVAQKFRTSCYFEIGLWWKQMLGGDFAKVGALCGGVQRQDEREACYLGLGSVVAPSADFEIPRTALLCGKMPTGEGRLLCAAGASWTFWAIPERREESNAVCESLQEKTLVERCLEKARLIDE